MIIRTFMPKKARCQRCEKDKSLEELDWFCTTDNKYNWMKCDRGDEYPHDVYFICKECLKGE